MPVATTSVGLISGVNTGDIVDALITAQRAATSRLESRMRNLQGSQLGYKTLEATILSISTSADTLSKTSTFTKNAVTVSDPTALTVSTNGSAAPGTSALRALQKATSHTLKSSGFASAESKVGVGTLSFARGGELDPSLALSLLNDGAGVRRGAIRITDRTGASADVDLSATQNLNDVIETINAGNANVTAALHNGRLVLSDRTGGSGGLTVRDLGGGQAAADLGIAGTASSGDLNGTSLFDVNSTTALSRINDGNPPQFDADGADLAIGLAGGQTLNVELSSSKTVGEIVEAINSHADNVNTVDSSKLVEAALVDGRIVLHDRTTGSGSFLVTDLGKAKAATALGLSRSAAGDTLTGGRLAAPAGTVLLRNLRGGQGVGTPGTIQLTDRTGATATVDLSAAETLEEVVAAINSAQTSGNTSLAIQVAIDPSGQGLVLTDSSGSTTSNLIVSDTTGDLAAGLGLATDSAENKTRSGPLGRQYINRSTELATYVAGGKAVGTGSFRLVNSSGLNATVTVDSSMKSLGEVIDAINATGISITATLNETGDGITLVDSSGGSDTLKVEKVGSASTAADLRLLGESTTDDNGVQKLLARQTVTVTTTATDTLTDLQSKLNAAGAGVTAQVFSDGGVNGSRLLLAANRTGAANRVRVDDGGLNLGFSTILAARDTVLLLGDNAATGVLLSSSSNRVSGVPGGLDVTVLKAGTGPVEATVAADTAGITNGLKQLVVTYNSYVDTHGTLTKFDIDANERGILQGDATILGVRTRLDNLLSGRYGTNAAVATLADLGVTFTATGKLSLDEAKLSKQLAEQPDAIRSFFTDRTSGFGVKLKTDVDRLTDRFTGTFKLEDNALSESIGRIETRVADLDSILAVRRDRLLMQFARMEEAISSIQSQQTALNTLLAQQQQR